LGRSDPLVFPWYRDAIKIPSGSRVLFLGQTGHNDLSRSLMCEAEFRDITLGNWDINGPLESIHLYDAIVCTRCAYFSIDPKSFIDKCLSVLRPGGKLFADWGLGDHWRFSRFRVGWNGSDEQEFAVYAGEKQHLRSSVWRDDLEVNPDVLKFKSHIEKFGYVGSLRPVIATEVDSLYEIPPEVAVRCLSLWPESPQLYILLEVTRDS